MAVYKIFPAADATLYSKFPSQNTGLDSILEVAVKNNENYNNSIDTNPFATSVSDDIRRSLIRFSNEDLNKLKSFRTGSWQAGLKLYLAEAENLSVTYSVEVRQTEEGWNMGTGHFQDDPEVRNGVCWYSTSSYYTTASSWSTTAADYYITPGGGSWTGLVATQSFDYNSSKDLNVNVTSIVNSWFTGTENYGFIVKLPIAMESSSMNYLGLSFFSVDTHTIYPPTLEMRWDDSAYSGNLSQIADSNFVVTLANNQGTYKYEKDIVKFRINARDKYPPRVFTTSSLYTTNKRLPQASYWAIQDYKTTDMVVDFDNNYTKISYDQDGSFANIYMNGLEPERYYKFLVRVNLPTGEIIDVDNDCIFKIVR